MLADECYVRSGPVDLGGGFEISIRVLMELIARLAGFEGRLSWDTSKPNGQRLRKLEAGRAKREVVFDYCSLLEGGLRRAIEWEGFTVLVSG